jgi:prephenate dehydratase
MIIGIQGGKGSFSESATKQFIERQKLDRFELSYLITSEKVLTAVENGQIDYGIFAIENSRGGVVLESIKALAAHRCRIIDMFHIRVEQNLLTASPNVKINDIIAIHSHRQALRQCREYLADHFWSCSLIEEDDTAEAARRLKEGQLPPTAAVIANKSCVELYNLTLFAENIHDLKNNLTLFLAVAQLEN